MRQVSLRSLLAAALAALACASAPAPRADEAQDKLLRGDLAGAVESYRAWRGRSGAEDPTLLHALALTTLEQALSSPSVAIRLAAVSAASRVGDSDLTEAIAARMADEDPIVAARATAALLRAHPDAPALMLASLRADLPAVRAISVETLGRKVGGEARSALVPLAADADAGVRAAVADALGAIGDDADLPQLLVIAAKDPAPVVRASALRAIARLPMGSRAEAALAAARAAVSDAYLGTRLAAIALLDKSWPRSRADLSATFVDPFTALRAAVVLAKRGDPTAARAQLANAVHSKDPSLRAAALNALAEVAPAAEGLPLGRSLARDPDPAVRLAAARALLRLDAVGEARPVLLAALGLSPELRLSAAADLARLGDARGVDAILRTLLEGPGAERVVAAEQLLGVL